MNDCNDLKRTNRKSWGTTMRHKTLDYEFLWNLFDVWHGRVKGWKDGEHQATRGVRQPLLHLARIISHFGAVHLSVWGEKRRKGVPEWGEKRGERDLEGVKRLRGVKVRWKEDRGDLEGVRRLRGARVEWEEEKGDLEGVRRLKGVRVKWEEEKGI